MMPVVEVDGARDTIRTTSYVALPLFILGFFGNGIMMRLMIKWEVRQYSSSIFLMGLAMSDMAILVYEVMDDIAIHIPSVTGFDILFGGSEWRCRFGTFFYQTARTVSAWLVVAMSAELCIAAVNPTRRKVLYMRNRTLYVAMAILLVAIAGAFPFLVLIQKGEYDADMPTCSSDYAVFFLVYSEFVLKGATQCVFPVIFIIACNLISFFAISRDKPQTGSSGFDRAEGYNSQTATNRRGGTLMKQIQAKSTIFVLTILYVLTILPATTAEIIIMVKRFFGDFEYTWEWNLAINITGVLFMANFAVKFYAIVLFGKEYRGAFAGKLSLYPDEPESNGQIPNGVANGGYAVPNAIRRPSEIRLENRL